MSAQELRLQSFATCAGGEVENRSAGVAAATWGRLVEMHARCSSGNGMSASSLTLMLLLILIP